VLPASLPDNASERIIALTKWLRESVSNVARLDASRVKLRLVYQTGGRLLLSVRLPAQFDPETTRRAYDHATSLWKSWCSTNSDLALHVPSADAVADTRKLNNADFAERMRARREKNRGDEEAEASPAQEGNSSVDSSVVIWDDSHGGAQF